MIIKIIFTILIGVIIYEILKSDDFDPPNLNGN